MNFLKGVEASKSRDLWRLLFGLGILHVGAGVAKALARHFPSLDDLSKASAEELTQVEDIGEVIARSVSAWFGQDRHRELIERLRASRAQLPVLHLSARRRPRSVGRQDFRADRHARHFDARAGGRQDRGPGGQGFVQREQEDRLRGRGRRGGLKTGEGPVRWACGC